MDSASAYGMDLSPRARTWVAVGSAALAFCYWAASLGARSTNENARVLFLGAMIFFGLLYFFSSSIWLLAGDARTIRAKLRPNLILYGTILFGFFLTFVGPIAAAVLTLVLAPIAALGASIRESPSWWQRSKT